MKNQKRYFAHLLKTNARALIIISVCVIILGFALVSRDMTYTHKSYYNDTIQQFVHPTAEYPNGYYHVERTVSSGIYYDSYYEICPCDDTTRLVKYRDTLLGYPMAVLMFTSVLVPIWIFVYAKKRRNLDCFYSLPISRRALATVHYLVGLAMAFVPFLLSYLQVLLSYFIIDKDMFGQLVGSQILAHFGICVLMGLVIYSISAFVFNEANSIFDGCAFVGTYLIAGYPLVNILADLLYWDLRYYEAEAAMPHLLFGEILTELNESIEPFGLHKFNLWKECPSYVIWLIAYAIIGLLAFAGFYYRSNRKAEISETQSNSIFGYKTIIPVLAFPLALSFCDVIYPYTSIASPIAVLFVVLATLVGYTIYRRGVKYKASDYIVLGLLSLLIVVAAANQ